MSESVVSLRPDAVRNVYDLVSAAGVDVSHWAFSVLMGSVLRTPPEIPTTPSGGVALMHNAAKHVRYVFCG